MLFSGFMTDDTSFLLLFLTCYLLFSCYLIRPVSGSYTLFFSYYLLFLCSFIVFCTRNLFNLYLFYEASLIPITYIIIKWGPYPDRAFRGLIMLIFTRVFTFPFSVYIFHLYSNTCSFFFICNIDFMLSCPFYLSRWLFFTFSVKLPLYGLHFWLPMAHVEAPTFGSIILAGILLKMGGCGLVRLSPMLCVNYSSFSSSILFYIFLSVLFSAIVCCSQSDFKRLVAYSFVFHISIVSFLAIFLTPLSHCSLLIIILFHGLSSPFIV